METLILIKTLKTYKIKIGNLLIRNIEIDSLELKLIVPDLILRNPNLGIETLNPKGLNSIFVD